MMISDYVRPSSVSEAIDLLARPGARAMAGGTDLLPLIRDGRLSTAALVDLSAIDELVELEADRGGLSAGSAVLLTRIASDERVRSSFPALARACSMVGSLQLRNMGTIGGNLCQRPRCSYFRHGFECLKLGGERCSAVDGENSRHVIFRTGACVAAHPSDPAVALTALDALVHLRGRDGDRVVELARFYDDAANRLHTEAAATNTEILIRVTVPEVSSGGVQYFEKLMDRRAWDFATVSVAACRREAGDVRLVLGGVAAAPWRVNQSVEEDVASGELGEEDFETLAQRALLDARPLAMNRYKVAQATALLVRAMRFVGRGRR
ncbi:MAG: FAD binding domain-containing protein [Gemmatimonadota bacterium]